MLKAWLKPLYSDDDGQPQGGDANDKPRTTDVLDRYGRDALKLAEKLSEALTDNYTLREKNRKLRVDNETLAAAKPPEGSVVLSGDDARLLDAYKALGEPGTLKQTLDAATQAHADLTTLRKSEVVRSAAEAHGFKPSVLSRLADGLELTMKEGKDKKLQAFVLKDDKELALDAYAEQEWADFLPSLTQQPAGDGVGSPAQGRKPASQIEVRSPGIRI